MARRKPQAKSLVTPLLGAHFSIAGGLHRTCHAAKRYHCNAIQIFTKNASTWKERQLNAEEIGRFEKARKEAGIRCVAAHTSYLINIASPEREKHRMSCRALKQELLRASALGIEQVVLHPGAHMGSGIEAGMRRIAESVRSIFSQTDRTGSRLLLETTAGQGSSLGHTFEQLADIMEQIDDEDRTGVCLDTSHIFAAGYDIRNERSYRQTMDAFSRIIGMKQLYLMHLNDSKKAFGTRVDRHEHIGHGHIGLKAFGCIINDDRLEKVPKIIETPKLVDGKDWDQVNLDRLRALVGS